MLDHEIIPKQKILCRELNTGKKYNGFFYFDDETIKTELCSFEEFFYIEEEKPIFLHSVNNQIISLHSNVSSPPGSHSRNLEPKMKTYVQSIISNTAVIGHDKWKEDDLIKRVSFNIKNSDSILKHKEIYDGFVKRKFTENYQSEIFSVTVNDITISVNYSATFTVGFSEPREIWPRVEIEFKEPATLANHIESVICVIRFFSLSLGVPLTPSDFKICRLSFQEMLDAVESRTYLGDYTVVYIWPEIDFYKYDLRAGGSLVIAYDNKELDALKNCLITWVSRNVDWNEAGIQMMHSLSLNGEISSDRLLASCKWFEEIPLTKIENTISDEHIRIITKAASEKALELGYGDSSNRITGSLRSIKTETNEERFIRLVTMVKDKFDLPFLGDDIVTYLTKALSYRGKIAHGHFIPSSDEEYRFFEKSIYAMESLCFLLMAYELPINDSGIKRINNNPFVQHYRLS